MVKSENPAALVCPLRRVLFHPARYGVLADSCELPEDRDRWVPVLERPLPGLFISSSLPIPAPSVGDIMPAMQLTLTEFSACRKRGWRDRRGKR